jgi:hypothetical protein
MNDEDLRRLVTAASALLRPHLEQSPPLRDFCRILGQLLIETAQQSASAPPSNAPVSTPEPAPSSPTLTFNSEIVVTPTPSAPTIEPRPVPPMRRISEPVLPVSQAKVPLKIGGVLTHVMTTGTTVELGRARQSVIDDPASRSPESDPWGTPDHTLDLQLIEKRSRLKARSCRVFMQHRAAEGQFVSDPRRRTERQQLIDEARQLSDCFLWVFLTDKSQPDDNTLQMVAESYDAQADAAALMLAVDAFPSGSGSDLESDAMRLLAEANSGLRVALEQTWLTKPDFDQLDTHRWLRHETASRRVYIAEFMSLDRPADPANAADLRERIAQASRRITDFASREKLIKATINQIRYEARRIENDPTDDLEARRRKIIQGVIKLRQVDIPPTDKRILQAIGSSAASHLSAMEATHDDLTLILAAIPTADTDERDDDGFQRDWSAAVLRVRDMIKGRRIVVIGGEPRPEAIERFQDAFLPSDVEWVELTEHGPGQPMQAPIARADTALVLVIIKLTGHLHADEARAAAITAAKPLVMLTAGYNPERVAHAVLEQASARLT